MAEQLLIPQTVGDDLFAPPTPPTIQDNVAANRALEESALLGDSSYNDRFEQYKASTEGLVMDAALERVMELNQESAVRELINNPDVSLENKLAGLTREVNDLSYRSLTPYDEVLFQILRQEGGGLVSLDRAQIMYEEIPTSSLRALSDISRERQLTRMRQDVNDVAAANGWGTTADALVEIVVQDFIPIFNIATRMAFNDAMADAAGVPLTTLESLLPGSARARMREAFVSMEPQELQEAVANMEQEVTKLQQHPVYGKLLTKYAILEHWSAVFNDDVLTQQNPEDNLDLWMGNLEIALEGTLALGVIAFAGGKTVRNAFRASDSVKLKNTATTVRNGEAVTKLNDAIKDEVLAANLQIESGAPTAAGMPKPTPLADDIELMPDNLKEIVTENGRLRSELLDSRINQTDSLLDVRDKARVVRKELDELAQFDGAVTHSRMSTAKIKDDGSGVEIEAMFGATPTKGWTDFEEVLIEALELDPELRQLDIMYVNDKGTMSKLDMTTPEFLKAVGEGDISLTKTGEILQGEEFFLRYKNDRPWHPFDKHFYDDPDAISSSWARFAFTPNAKFSDQFYAPFARAALDEQRTVAILNQMSSPYQLLSVADKKMANGIFEWGEQFGRVQRRNANYHEIISEFPEATPATVEGVIAMRNTMDTMYDMLNARVHREFNALGFSTAKPVDPTLPTYHGKIATSAEQVQPGSFLDPETGDLIKLNRKQIEDHYVNGDSIIQELPISVGTNKANEKVTRVLLKGDAYSRQALSENPLRYHAGYTMRFHDDPYYVVKKNKNAMVDGIADPVGGTEAVRTTGTYAEGERWAARANRAMQKRYGDGAATFETVRASNLEQGESALFQKEVLQQEGRLFYDERNHDILPNTNGTKAEIEDPGIALERGIHIASRQLSQEDPLRAVKEGWSEQYGDLVKEGQLNRPGVSLKAVEQELDVQISNAPGPAQKARVKDAREYVRYMRLMEGTNSKAVTMTRSSLVAAGQALHGFLGVGNKRNTFFRWWEKRAAEAEPLRLVRSVAFNLFMKLRPIRQFVMQSAQVGFLAGLDPAYVTTGRIFKDMYMLQAGRTAFRSGTDISEKALAKAMGIHLNEYRVLVKQFDRSGLIDSVDVHSYTGQNVAQANPTKLPTGGPLSGAGYYAKKGGGAILNAAGTGFKLGESNNLAGTYMISLRRYLKKNPAKSIGNMDVGDWERIRVDTSNLALAMIKPNNMRYQTGFLSMATQFLSFTHKASLALIGKNPAMSTLDAAKLWIAGGMLYGAEFIGTAEFVGAVLSQNNLDHVADQEVPGTDDTFANIIKYGLLDQSINAIGRMTTAEWQELDLSFVSPGPNTKNLYEMTIMNILSDPWSAAFGPAASIGQRVWKSLEHVHFLAKGDPEMPAVDKYLLMTKAVSEGAIPFVNDIVSAYQARLMDRWYTSAGEPLPIKPENNSIKARGALGVRPRAETTFWAIKDAVFKNESNVNAIVKSYKNHFRNLWLDYYKGEISQEVMQQQMIIVGNFFDDFPDGQKAQILEKIFIDKFDDGSESITEMIGEQLSNGIFDPAVYDAINEMGLPEDEVLLMQEMYRDAYGRTLSREPEIKEIFE